MLFIAESPLHFALALTTTIVILISALLIFLGVIRTEKPLAGFWSAFLTLFFAFFTFLILTIMMYQLPAAATADQLFPYYIGAWTCVGLHAFFLLFYVVGFEWFRKRVWAAFLPLLGTISFMVVLWVFATPATSIVVSDGVMNWLALPLIVVGYGGFLAIFYMLLIPLIRVYSVTKTQTGLLKQANWFAWIGLLLWFIAAIMMALVQYTAPYMSIALALAALAWLIMLIAWFLLVRGQGKPVE